MNHKRPAILLLCLALLFLAITGCTAPGSGNIQPDPDAPSSNDGSLAADPGQNIDNETPGGIDFNAAIASFSPDTIMIRSGALSITWADLYVFLFRTVSDLIYTYGPAFDWSDGSNTGNPLSDVVLEYAAEEALTFLAYMYGAESLGLTLSNEEIEEFTEDINGLIEMYGSKELFEASLLENGGFYSLDVFEKLFRIEYTVGLLITKLYGENTSLFPDDRVAEYAEENGFLMAMHILRLKKEDDNTPLEESEAILKQLNEHRDSEGFQDVFFSMMNQHSEDHGGLASSPNGYLFQFTDMVEPFSLATVALEIGQMSDIVETVYGYHIILRIPIDDEAVPSSLSREGIFRTLRQIAALSDFETLLHGWRDAMNVEYTSEFRSIDLAAIFKTN